MKKKLKRVFALLLSAAMMTSEFTALQPQASAEETTQVASSVSDGAIYGENSTGRPNLFVSFLGDNKDYIPAGSTAVNDFYTPAAYDFEKTTNPTVGQWSKYTQEDRNKDIIFWVGVGVDRLQLLELLEGDGTYSGLTSFEAGFYYDDNVVEPYVPTKADGATDLAGYTDFIQKQNMNSSGDSNHWNSNYYEVLRAETGLSVQMDPVTQEEITLPSNNQILTNKHNDGHEASWKMAYYSIELKEAARDLQKIRRFYDQYNTTATPAAASGTEGYYYLLMIPFRLKKGPETDMDASHIRLIRNATHFSMGGGTYGTNPYGQWEKVTSRTPDHELKLMTYFTGDLLLFKDGKNTDPDYQAKLIINQGGNGNNKAALSVNSDPSPNPVKINRSGDSIYKLRSGLGMLVEVEKASGYNVTVTVDYEEKDDTVPSGKRTVHWDLTASYVSISADGSKRQYTFNLPEFIPPASATRLVTVTVTFGYENRPFSNIYLSEIHQDKNGTLTTRKVGNEATVTVDLLKNATDNTFDPADPSAVVSMDSFSPIDSIHPTHTDPVYRYDEYRGNWSTDKINFSHDPGPSVEAQHTIATSATTSESTFFSVDVSVHEDYEAVVQIYNFQDSNYAYGNGTGGNMNYVGSFNVTNSDVENRFTPYGQIVLRHGGTLVFSVPSGDVDVEITYRPAKRYKAKLEVYHPTGTEVKAINVAQLIYTEYDSLNTPQRALSGEVYEDEPNSNHSAVKNPGKALPWISLSESDRSLSLGGDTSRTATAWSLNTDTNLGPKAIMSLLAADTIDAQADLTDSLTALNLSGLTLGTGSNTFTGLRKDLQGTAFEDGDASVLSDYLWEIRQQIKADPTLETTYLKSVTASSGTGTAYQYFDLTPNQVQWYILQCLNAEQLYNQNLQNYREVQQRYLTQKARCDEMLTQAAYSGLAVIGNAPEKVMDISVDSTTFVRSYYGTDYADYLTAMDTYLADYAQYLTDVANSGSVSGTTAPDNYPNFTSIVSDSKVAIASDTDAAAAVSTYAWDTPTVPTDSTAHTIETRENRLVYVALEADSEYELESVQILDKAGNAPLSTPVTQVTGYRNVYSFKMPQEDCTVRVTYQKRGTLTVTGEIKGCDNVKDNVAKIELYSKNSGYVTPQYNLITNLSDSTVADVPKTTVNDVLRGSLVTVTAKVDSENYEVKVTAITNTGITIISDPVAAPAPDPDGGTVYYFPMPTGMGVDRVDILVEYTKKNQTKNDAHIRTTTDYGLNTAFWYTGTGYVTDYISVAEGTDLTAYITVRPGYYIDTVTAYGASGTYSFTLSGNGYNGGNGAINTSGTTTPGAPGDNRVKLTTTMPDEEYWVMVTFKRGVPPVEPGQTLTLTVKDPDNTAPVDNYAYAMVSDTNIISDASYTRLPTGTAYLGKTHSSMQDTQSVPQGKLVTVRFKAAEGYYASSVEVTPSTLGVTPVWETRDAATGESVVTFVMPSASCGVTVTFSKTPAAGEPTYKLQVLEKFSDGTPYDAKNYVTTITADTIAKWWSSTTYAGLTAATNPEMVPPTNIATATGVAKAGETVTATFKIDESQWYVKSVALLYPGGVRYLDYTLKSTDTDGTKIYETSFAMPPSMSQLVVTYHQGPKLAVEDFDVSLRLIDNDNVQHLASDGTTTVYFDNGATLTGSVSATTLTVGGSQVLTTAPLGDGVYRTMQDRGHFHAGETMTLNISRESDRGYQLEYAIVTPSGIVTLNWLSATKATFVMPNEEITVIVKIIKGDPRQYTVNLILRLPDGSTANINDVGQGSLVMPDGVTGSITDYPNNAIFSTVATPGTQYGLDLYAFPGYYIDRITIDPAASGATANYTGNVGYQTGDFVMPYMDINVNVWFEEGWPDEIPYDLTLNVYDPAAGFADDGTTHKPDNFARFQAIGGSLLSAPKNDPVYGVAGQKTLTDAVLDNQTVVVRIHKDSGYDWDAEVMDRSGVAVSWWRVPGGIAFTAPPSHATVNVTFRATETKPQLNLTLHVVDPRGGDAARIDGVEKSWTLTTSGTLSGVEAGDTFNLTATPGSDRHISAVYAYLASTGATVPIYLCDSAMSIYSDCSQLANFLPNGLNSDEKGQFVIPDAKNGDTVHVYVVFDDRSVDPAKQLPATLWVSGSDASGSFGSATMALDDNQSATVSATGMKTLFTTAGTAATVTFNPADGCYISKLEVYDKNGNPVPYEWISMILDPTKYPDGTLSGSDVWPSPAPGLGNITTPDYVPNPKLQIKLTVPTAGLTVHVTYTKPTDRDLKYKVQVVVNNGGGTDNDANIKLSTESPADYRKKFYTTAGSWIDLDVTVQAGYKIEYVIAVPQGYGVAPSLPLGDIYSQTTGFTMPAGDIVVYVKFTTDTAERKTATLVVNGEPNIPANYATIHSDISGTSPNVEINHTPQSVVARPSVDWVTVDYYWNPASTWVKSVVVTNLSGTVTLPFTQLSTGENGHGKITLPMDANDILITVTYAKPDDPDLKLPQVILHVIDDTGGSITTTAQAYGKLYYTPTITTPSGWATGVTTPVGHANYGQPDTGETAPTPTGNEVTMSVPAGENMNFEAFVASGYYIKSAYVYFEDTSQVVHASFADNTGTQTDTFAVHPGTNHVYLRVTNQKPDKVEHNVVLTLEGPTDASGMATIQNTVNSDSDRLTQANHGFATVTGATGDGIQITVTPAEGFVIDRIEITPLGFPLDSSTYNWVYSGNTIIFDMPHINVGVKVILKRGVSQKYNARLHFIPDPQHTESTACTLNQSDLATLSWLNGAATETITANETTYHGQDTNAPTLAGGGNAAYTQMEVAEGATVTLQGDTYLNTSGKMDVILNAYVLRGTVLVPLTPSADTGRTAAQGLEGLSGNLVTNDYANTATFTMPAEDVDVYLVVTNDPPTDPWHTVVLIPTDKKGALENTGDNLARLWKTSAGESTALTADSNHTTATYPDHVALALEEGASNTFSAKAEPAAGYALQLPATVTYNTAPFSANLSPRATSPYYVYQEALTRNAAVHMHFISEDKLKLTVELVDEENPNNGTVTQSADVSPTGLFALHLTSTNSFGAYQIISGVTSGSAVKVEATPNAGYQVLAKVTDGAGEVTLVTLTLNSSGKYTGSFTMPDTDSTLTIIFTTGYTGTLTLVDRTAAKNHQAAMWDTFQADTAGTRRVVVNNVLSSAQLTGLPNGDTLVAKLTTTLSSSERLTALLTRKGSTTLLPAATDTAHDVSAHFDHTIDRADARITLIVDDNTTSYIAAVRAINAPSGSAATIKNSNLSVASYGTWTPADSGNTVITTVTVPAGYKAVLTAVDSDGHDVNLTYGSTNGTTIEISGSATNQEISLTMPAANVQVTVEYVKTAYTLTLQIVGTGSAEVKVAGMTTTLTSSGASMTIPEGTPMPDVTTTFNPIDNVRAFYRSEDGGAGNIANSGDTFTMPASDTTVTVVFGASDDKSLIAYTEVIQRGGSDPANKVTALRDLTATPAQNYSPAWISANKEDSIQVSYEAADGWYVQVTATDMGTNTTVPVSQLGLTGNGYALVQMPNANLKLTITFTKDKPSTSNAAALRLVAHEALENNHAQLSAQNLTTITLAGNESGCNVVPSDPLSDVEKKGNSVASGDQLRTMAWWDTASSVSKITMAIRDKDGHEGPESELTLNQYGLNVTAQSVTPYLRADDIPVIRVYYGSRFTATMHIVGASAGDQTKATDDRSPSETDPVYADDFIYADGDKLINMAGTETVTTTAVPDTTATPAKRLVGVVRESPLTGAYSATRTTYGSQDYAFPMLEEDVDFYVIYEEEPDDPKDKSYIAKVAFHEDSQPIAGTNNAVSIRNVTNPAASAGTYWTAAKGDDTVTVTVKVAAGYQAEIISTIKDAAHTGGTAPDGTFDFYISRTLFVPNLPNGKEATFTMPANSDATVVVKFTKGYRFTLDFTDNSLLPPNRADVTVGSGSLFDENTGNTVYHNTKYLSNLTGSETTSTTLTRSVADIPTRVLWYSAFTGTKTLLSAANSLTGANSTLTEIILPAESMVQADVTESVLFRNPDDPDNLLAKVEVKGETDITGNSATPIVDNTTPYPATTTGTVWTTTAQGNTIDLTLTVAKGYKAKITVLIDNAEGNTTNNSELYLDAQTYAFKLDGDPMVTAPGIYTVEVEYADATSTTASFPGSVSDPRHFTFTMPSGPDTYLPSDVTVIVEFVYADLVPQPYTPEYVNSDSYGGHSANYITGKDLKPSFLSEGFIYGENRGDFAIIDIPTLFQNEDADADKTLFDTNNYDTASTKDATKKVTYRFYLRSGETYTLLEPGVDIDLIPYDEDTLAAAGDSYNYYETQEYTSPVVSTASGTKKTYTGSKFLLVPREDASGAYTAAGQKVFHMLDNNDLGSLVKEADGSYKTQLYVTAQNALGQESEFSEVWIRPYFQLKVNVNSYAPTHPLTGYLYRLMTLDELNAAEKAAGVADADLSTAVDDRNLQHYRYKADDDPLFTVEKVVKLGSDYGSMWRTTVAFRSSELLGGWNSGYDPDPTTNQGLLRNVIATENMTYAFTLRKISNIPYNRVDLDLNPKDPATGDYLNSFNPDTDKYPGYYESETRSFRVQDVVTLFAGSVRGYDRINESDASYLRYYLSYNYSYVTDPTDPDWKISIYNPRTGAYRSDLNGDGEVTMSDYYIMHSNRNWLRYSGDYKWVNSSNQMVLPFGFGKNTTSGEDWMEGYDFPTLFALWLEEESYPLAEDEYWSVLNDSDTPVPLPEKRVDEDDHLLDDADEPSSSTPDRAPGTSVTVPGRTDREDHATLPEDTLLPSVPPEDPGPDPDKPAPDEDENPAKPDDESEEEEPEEDTPEDDWWKDLWGSGEEEGEEEVPT